jgi:hypothetical protein
MQYSSVDESDSSSLHSCSLRSKHDDSASRSKPNAFRPSKRGVSSQSSDLSEPLTAASNHRSLNEELGDASDPFFVFRADLQTKLELVDEGLAEYLRVVHETVCKHKQEQRQLVRKQVCMLSSGAQTLWSSP